METIQNKVINFYKQTSYIDKYGGSITWTLLIFILFFSLTFYFYLLFSMETVKKDWNKYKCSPAYMPFAGFINPPQDGTSKIQYTANNMNYCIQNTMRTFIGYAFLPINYFVKILEKFFKIIAASIDQMRILTQSTRNRFADIIGTIYNQLFNSLVPIQHLIIKLVDLCEKTFGILTVGLYTAFGSYLTLKSSLELTFNFIVRVLLSLAAIIIILFAALQFGPAVALTAIFLSISIPLSILAVIMKKTFKLQLLGIPRVPRCFDKNTIITTENGPIPIYQLKVDDKLSEDNFVESIQEVSSEDQVMYRLNNVIVSGLHSLVFNDKLIHVKDHPEAKKIENYNKKVLYCFNCSKKSFDMDGKIWSDWDDLNQREIQILKNNCFTFFPNGDFDIKKINSVLDGGLNKNTLIDLENGMQERIKNIKIGDFLKNQIKVLGLVKVSARNKNSILLTTKNDSDFKIECFQNIQLNTLANLNRSNVSNSKEQFYHLITDKQYFSIGDYFIRDFNGSIDFYLNRKKI